MNPIPSFESEHLASIAKILADTANGLTGSQIEQTLRESRIPDPTPSMTKWKRLYNAFAELQNERQFGNHVVVFINRAMKPVQYTGDPGAFATGAEKSSTPSSPFPACTSAKTAGCGGHRRRPIWTRRWNELGASIPR
jgi:hypothetical protein